MNIHKVVLIASAFAFAFAFASTSATAGDTDDKWHTELLAGVSFPTEDFGSIKLDAGSGFEGTVSYQLTPSISAYGGWGWYDFSSNGPEVVQQGYVVGMQLAAYSPNRSTILRVRAGVTYEHIELQNNLGNVVYDSKPSTGFEIGAALAFPFVGDWEIVPGIRYRSLNRPIEINGVESNTDLNYFALDVSICL